MTFESAESSSSSLKPNYIPLGLPGLPSVKNRGALDWCINGLAAFGNGTDVIILDPLKLVPVTFLPSEHKFVVNMVLWNPHARPFLIEKPDKQPRDLVSVDTAGNLIIWDVGSCHAVTRFVHSELKGLLSLKWSNGADVWQKTKLFLLYSNSMFVILDIVTLAHQNIILESQPGSNDISIIDFDCEPSTSTSASIAFVGENSVYLKANWDPLKMKQERIVFSKSVVYNAKSSSLSVHASQDVQTIQKKSGIRKLVSDIIVGAEYPSASTFITAASGKPPVTIQFHTNLNYHLIVCTSRDIYIINTQFSVLLNTFSLERSSSNFVQVILSHKRPALITLHENGAICLRKYVITGIHTQAVSLETIATSDPPRLSAKKSEVLGAVFDKYHENKVILHLSDGRFMSYDIVSVPAEAHLDLKVQHLVTPMTPFVPASSTSNLLRKEKDEPRKLLPALVPLDKILGTILQHEADVARIRLKKATIGFGTLTCVKSRVSSETIVAGTSTGYILVLGFEDNEHQKKCVIRKRFSVHSNTPVSGIEFISDNEIISFANASFSANPKCEMIMTEIESGATKILKQDDPHHIHIVRVSPLAQALLLVYKNGMAPCELWDLERRQLIKALPNKLPPINCAVWKESAQPSKKKEGKGAEEVFYMTDFGTLLFTFRVEGNRFSSATCVKLDTGGSTGGIPVSLVSRGKLVFRADSSGTLVIYDTEKKTASPGVPLGRGPLLKVTSGEEDYSSYVVVQFTETVELWHLTEIKRLKVLAGPKQSRIIDFCWMNSFLVTISRASGGISFIAVGNDVHPTVSIEELRLFPYFFSQRQKFLRVHILLQKGSLNHQELIKTFQDICSFEESDFWTIVSASMLQKSDFMNRGFGCGLTVYSEDKFYKEVMVKLAQCVWFSDMTKREDVAKVLLWAGEQEKSAEMLLDTEPSEPSKYVSNGMKAALCVGATTLPESTKAVLKIVATNLLASGETDDGLEMLCLLSKHADAVKYLESANEWSKAILLSKTSLSTKQAHDCLSKYGHFLNDQRQVIKSASVYAYIGRFDRVIEVLFGGRKRHLCYLLLTFCENEGTDLSNLSDHVKTAIRLDFARLIFDCGLFSEAIAFCDKIGDDAKDLRSEMEILGS